MLIDFKNKKITIMGLGLLGRGINVVKFFAQAGADLIVTDLKTKEQLKPALEELKKFKKIKYVLGKHRLIDFKNRDLIIKAPSVPFDSKYIKEAKKNKIPIEMDASLFAKLAEVKIIGITGTRGKSTVTDIVYQILKKYYKNGNVFLSGNVKGMATLPLLKKVKKNDLVVLELDSWQLQGFNDSKISPDIAVFTNFLRDHMNYYRNSMNRYFNDKASIFKYQDSDSYLVVSQQAKIEIKKRFRHKIKSKIIKASNNKWETKLLGQHNQDNINLAVEVLKLFEVKDLDIKKYLKTYSGMPGRLELVREFNGIKYYNDTNATSPEATIAAIKAINKNIILIAGGNDKELKYREMVKIIEKKVKTLILIEGTATNKIIDLMGYSIKTVNNMKDAVEKANKFAKKGDVVLLSPGAASFGIFKNEYDRGDQFKKYVREY
ncbi:MAG: UDP-N-acetylmuramoyl-L-alanine--D-glutamate ligase [Candidatus Portnoybacteria bacterium]|nr:UDP-N-acetylmuramoyl-L-alanine--D-glutamate ligase [Candidatus Portnoybacteria bacterium]